MKKVLFMAALALMCILSCEKREILQTSGFPDEKVKLDVSIPLTDTKALTADGEADIHSLQVFVFRPDGTLDAYMSGAGTSSLTLEVTLGRRKVMAVVNAPELGSVLSEDALNSAVSDLADNSSGHFVMTGTVETEVVLSKSVEIPVRRLVARVSISMIANEFSSLPYQQPGVDFRIVGIYLADVAGTAGYFGAGNDDGRVYNSSSAGVSDELPELLSAGTLSEPLAYRGKYETPHYFYCYPKSLKIADETEGNRCTRLVVKTVLNGRTCYYTVPFENIESNHSYNVTMTITRPGSSDAGEAVVPGSAVVTVKVADWVGTDDQVVTI